MSDSKWLPTIALIQGGFYLATGIWPLLDIESFQDVTGPKTDLWLVPTVGVLVAVIGGVLLLADAAAEVGLAVLWGWGRLRR